MGRIISNTNEAINHLHSKDKRWFAIYTKYKCEKYVVSHLLKKGVDAYVPLIKTTKQYVRKIKTYEKPLINCYVFVCITKEEYIRVLETEYVFKFLRQRKDLISIPKNEIQLLKHIVGEYQEGLSICSENYILGEAVEVIAGSLTGLKGIVIDIKNKKEFVIELDHIGIHLLMNINPGYLRPVKSFKRVNKMNLV